jgi:hypothetical protein
MFNFGTSRGRFRSPVALPQGKRPGYQLGKGLGRPQSRTGRCKGKKIILHTSKIEPRSLGCPARSPAPISTDLLWPFLQNVICRSYQNKQIY